MPKNPFSLPGLPGVPGMQSKLPSDAALNPRPVMVRPEQAMNPEARAMRFRRLASMIGRPKGTGLAPAPVAAMPQPTPMAPPLAPPPGLNLKKRY